MMAHSHSVIDTDVRFHIDPYTRSFTDTTPAKKTIVQYDHNSERYTFDMPRYIEGHDMTLCNIVEVHFINVDKSTSEQIDGPIPITDLHISSEDENTIVFSWLVTRASTQYIGPLKFSIHFECKEEDGTISYEWNTALFTRISVKSGGDNREAIDHIKELIDENIELLGYEIPVTTYILVDEEGNEAAAVLVDEEVELTATANDIRIDTTAVTNEGVTTGEKVIPAYHTYTGIRLITAGSDVTIPNQDATIDNYDYTKLQAIICLFNTSSSDSVSTEKVLIEDNVYNVKSVESISIVTKNHDTKTIELGISNDTNSSWILRYFTYKEII